MTMQQIVKKLNTIQKELITLRQYILKVEEPKKSQNNLQALSQLQGLWSKKPRTKKQLEVVRKRLWS